MDQHQGDSSPSAGALRLDQFFKLNSIVGTGGEAKLLIQSGEVKVNGETEIRRRRKLVAGDVVELGGQTWVVNHPRHTIAPPPRGNAPESPSGAASASA